MTGYPAAHAKLITTFSKQVWERRQEDILLKRLTENLSHFTFVVSHTLMIYFK